MKLKYSFIKVLQYGHPNWLSLSLEIKISENWTYPDLETNWIAKCFE